MTDIVERLRDWSEFDEGKINDAREEAAAEIERLRDHLRVAIMSDSEECKFLTADNERLRAALENIAEMTKPEVRTGAKARPYAEQNIHFFARATLAQGGDK